MLAPYLVQNSVIEFVLCENLVQRQCSATAHRVLDM